MLLSPFEFLAEASLGLITGATENPKIPQNQGNYAYIPETPRKKLKGKRKATGPPPKEQPNAKTAIFYLALARKAIESALRVEKEKKKEEYIIVNDIQRLKDILEEI
jgi:hypothetical protein